jgi:hypothetical protein
MRRSGLVSFAALTVLVIARVGAGCVDGVTPDCSDAATCAPGATDAARGDANVVPDTGSGSDASDSDADAGSDAANDAADTDGG